MHSKNEKLPQSLEAALSIIVAAGLPHQTALVNSGNGAYAQYLFTEPYVFDDAASREQAGRVPPCGVGRRQRSRYLNEGRATFGVSDLAAQ